MDYTLKSLLDVFIDEEYKVTKRYNSLYVMVLATSLDIDFVREYLSYYDDVNSFSGKDVLIMGPQFGDPYSRGTFQNRHGISAYSFFNSNDPEAQESFLQFMHQQTIESYSVAKFLGIRTDNLPVAVFFENLDNPKSFVIWKLNNFSGKEFVRRFRTLLEDVGEKCGWNEKNRVAYLQLRIDTLNSSELYSNHLDDKILKQISLKFKSLQDQLLNCKCCARFYENLEELRLVFDTLVDNQQLKVHLNNIETTIKKLEAGLISPDSFDHLRKHLKRWKTRLPEGYKKAVNSFFYPYNCIKNERLVYSRKDSENVVELEQKIEELKISFRDRKQEVLTNWKAEMKIISNGLRAPVKPLEVVGASLQLKSDEHKESELNLKDSIRKGAQPNIPKVFISYSHDSVQHKVEVLDLAQRLRSDHIDAWIDQFVESPEWGFPRWMQNQITEADFVFLICTSAYNQHFNGSYRKDKGRGVNFEGHIILQDLYESGMKNGKFIPVLFPNSTIDDIPIILRGYRFYSIPVEYQAILERVRNNKASSQNDFNHSPVN